MRADIEAYLRRLDEVPGWFFHDDFAIFDWLLGQQAATGDLLEIGAYQGRSAILLGMHQRQGEALTICDLFGMPAETDVNRAESEAYYSDLTCAAFERHYLAWLPTLPTIVQESSLSILDHVKPGSCRFVHVDGAHLYDYAAADVNAARTMLADDGIVVCDDWRTDHAPGVTFAVMEAVVAGLHPIVVTEAKLYGSWDAGTADRLRPELTRWAQGRDDMDVIVEPVRGVDLPRVSRRYQQPVPTFRQRLAGRVGRMIAGQDRRP